MTRTELPPQTSSGSHMLEHDEASSLLYFDGENSNRWRDSCLWTRRGSCCGCRRSLYSASLVGSSILWEKHNSQYSVGLWARISNKFPIVFWTWRVNKIVSSEVHVQLSVFSSFARQLRTKSESKSRNSFRIRIKEFLYDFTSSCSALSFSHTAWVSSVSFYVT